VGMQRVLGCAQTGACNTSMLGLQGAQSLMLPAEPACMQDSANAPIDMPFHGVRYLVVALYGMVAYASTFESPLGLSKRLLCITCIESYSDALPGDVHPFS